MSTEPTLDIIHDGGRSPVGQVIFVHGLRGNRRETWEASPPDEGFWPDWLGEAFPTVAIGSVGYDAAATGWGGSARGLIDRAQTVAALLFGERRDDLPTIFVCHSLGGLVVKEILHQSAVDSGRENAWVKNMTKGVAFLATPHAGSKIADWAEASGWLGRSSAVTEDLGTDSDYLSRLTSWYARETPSLKIETIAFSETKPTAAGSGPMKSRFKARVVTRESANPQVPGVRLTDIETDHIAIAKPASRNSIVYRNVARFVDDILLERETSNCLATAQQDSTQDWSINADHERLTAGLLKDVPGQFFKALQGEIARRFPADLRPESAEDMVQWFARSSKDIHELLELFYVVRGALHDWIAQNGDDQVLRQQAEEAAVALYCLAACRWVDRTAHAAGNYLLQVPRTDNVIYAVIATGLFGGQLRIKQAAESLLPHPEYVFEVPIPAGGIQQEKEFERAAFNALLENSKETQRTSLDWGPLEEDQRQLLQARFRTFRDSRKVSFALVVHGVADAQSISQYANEQRLPVFVSDDTVSNLYLVQPKTLKAEIQEFWSELRPAAAKKKGQEQQPPSSKGSSDMASSGINITAGDGATIAFTTGDKSPAHGRHQVGFDATTFRDVLQEILDAIKAEPAGETREALVAEIEGAKNEIAKPEPDTARVQNALDAVDKTVKKGAGILEGGEKIAGLLYRAYNQLSSMFDLPPTP